MCLFRISNLMKESFQTKCFRSKVIPPTCCSQRRGGYSIVRSGQVRLGWVGLGWVGLGWVMLGWVMLGYVRLGQDRLGQVSLGYVRLICNQCNDVKFNKLLTFLLGRVSYQNTFRITCLEIRNYQVKIIATYINIIEALS